MENQEMQNQVTQQQVQVFESLFSEGEMGNISTMLGELDEINFKDSFENLETLEMISKEFIKVHPEYGLGVIDLYSHFSNLVRITNSYKKEIDKCRIVFRGILDEMI